ncbi:hypothetical protein L7F22_021345 [Adiantum nelumboides]|nr:hypothetical protein [Adiantum nelumboides]
MGNYISCSCSCACINSTSSAQRAKVAAVECKRKLEKVIIVVHSVEERVLEMGGGTTMKVAELMLEFPGHFVVKCEADISTMICETDVSNQQQLDVKRATPLPADHEASPGHIYILFPMHRLHTRLSPHESASYEGLLSSYIANSHLQHIISSFKKKNLHSLMQTSSSKVTPLSSLHLDDDTALPSHLSASYQPLADANLDADAHIDDEIDLLLQHFCSPTSSACPNSNVGSFMNRSGSLVRSKSWIPKLETISESSILVV